MSPLTYICELHPDFSLGKPLRAGTHKSPGGYGLELPNA